MQGVYNLNRIDVDGAGHIKGLKINNEEIELSTAFLYKEQFILVEPTEESNDRDIIVPAELEDETLDVMIFDEENIEYYIVSETVENGKITLTFADVPTGKEICIYNHFTLVDEEGNVSLIDTPIKLTNKIILS